MKKGSIQLGDWHRILFGNTPPDFLLEVVGRSIVMYLALLLTLRLLGKRMNAQISISELAVMISIGGIVSLPMQSAGRGLLDGIVLLCTMLLLQRMTGLLSLKSGRAEAVVYGRVETLLKDGVLQTQRLRQEAITRDQLFAELRRRGVNNLGELDRVYMEAYGMFSLFHARSPRPGLSTLPEKDRPALTTDIQAATMACGCCGTTLTQDEAAASCPHCGGKQWTEAVL